MVANILVYDMSYTVVICLVTLITDYNIDIKMTYILEKIFC